MSLLEEMKREIRTSEYLQKRYTKRLDELKKEDELNPEFITLNKFGHGHYGALLDSEVDKHRMLQNWVNKLERSDYLGSKISTTV